MHALEQELHALRPYLLRFARLQLRNAVWAEDAVSETIVAALSKPQTFAGRSALKTWLVGILKHKVLDAMRLHARECVTSPVADADSHTDPLEEMAFTPDGHYAQAPSDWGTPEQHTDSQQFIRTLELCMQRLPDVQARLFLMREWLELSSEEICKELNLSATNLYVQLHRARLRLRECLQLHWIDGKAMA
ncbi:sigma-70 family RNA polymerase sigma factor [Curvibacter sp. CHRR-16]|uniref:sigma-70 family RNA polymerase sigma factor n=1 Tax=Curvibacter sp. CHRR-16 TaxID=2835872 RepID=UPI001BDB30B1|nr:sigma-70 family RNA polymerase sigma factor [Curvibacter sp. CHRR-16]MBT0570097.1 sigma-70 family RNA polymerase sigma factor [Curvibacter sp. CHRR-16]